MIDIPLIALANEAEREVYILIDKHLRALPKDRDGTINTGEKGFQHNDVDALRHAYTSGVFTMEYGERAAAFLGGLRERLPIIGSVGTSGSNKEKAKNMDLWNNSIGRKYGKESKTREELFQYLLKALKNGELIIDLNDERKYSADTEAMDSKVTERIVVLKESETGENLLFLDTHKMVTFSREDFVVKIKNGEYKDYEIRMIGGKEIPASKRDGVNNLG